MAYDSQCFKLAKHFLGDLVPDGVVNDLAQYIQDEVEDWIEFERDKKLLNYLMPGD